MLVLKTPAMLLRRSDYGESNRMVLLATRDAGTLSAVARSARKSVRRFGGALELFTVLDAELVRRTEEEPWTLERARILRYHDGYAADIGRYAAGCYAIELYRMLVRGELLDEAVFGWLVAFVERWEHGMPDPVEMVREELALLDVLGHAPRFDRCVGCGKEAPASAWARFDAAAGGIVCSVCSGGNGTRIGSRLRAFLIAAQRSGPGEALAAESSLESAAASDEASVADCKGTASSGSPGTTGGWEEQEGQASEVEELMAVAAKNVVPLRKCMDSYIRALTEREPRTMPSLLKTWGLE